MSILVCVWSSGRHNKGRGDEYLWLEWFAM